MPEPRCQVRTKCGGRITHVAVLGLLVCCCVSLAQPAHLQKIEREAAASGLTLRGGPVFPQMELRLVPWLR
jgi:hypothetical protein